jgi:hypothetical protein
MGLELTGLDFELGALEGKLQSSLLDPVGIEPGEPSLARSSGLAPERGQSA